MWIDEPAPVLAPVIPAPEIPPEIPVDAVRIDDLVPSPAAPAFLAESPDQAAHATPIPHEPTDEERAAALLTGLWVGGAALHASAPIPPADDEDEERRAAGRPRWRPRNVDDVKGY
jgi:hypothetical protein